MLLGLQNVTFEFGARVIVEDATWHIQPNERIGLIGYNGTGKSTLLKVLTNQFLPSRGTVEKGKETTIGFLHQDLLSFDTEESILQVALSAFEKVQALEKEIEKIGAGGLSGKPLQKKSTEVLQYIIKNSNNKIPVIASGGIFTGADAIEKLNTGAARVQVWTGFIYEGPSIVKKINKQLIHLYNR